MPDIYLYFARKDEELARRLGEMLLKHGHAVLYWRDPRDPPEPPHLFGRSVVAVVLWTEHSIHSGWIRAMADYARSSGKLVSVATSFYYLPPGFRDTGVMLGDEARVLAAIRPLDGEPKRRELDLAEGVPPRTGARFPSRPEAPPASSRAEEAAPVISTGGPKTTPGLAGRLQRASVDATAFAPNHFRAGESELVEVVVHLKGARRQALRAAKMANPRAAFAAPSVDMGDINVGDRVSVSIRASGATVEDAPEQQIWRGNMLTFGFRLTSDGQTKHVAVVAVLAVNDVLVGRIAFSRRVARHRSFADVLAQIIKPRLSRFQRVFFSYSSADRARVLDVAQQYKNLQIEFFQDILDLDPGDRWRRRLWREIDRCDLFLLFWSSNAMKSEWVIKEAERAWRRQARNGGKRPVIRPEVLEVPPPLPEQEWLREFHFNDPRFHRIA